MQRIAGKVVVIIGISSVGSAKAPHVTWPIRERRLCSVRAIFLRSTMYNEWPRRGGVGTHCDFHWLEANM
jgi:hypothetical protein